MSRTEAARAEARRRPRAPAPQGVLTQSAAEDGQSADRVELERPTSHPSQAAALGVPAPPGFGVPSPRLIEARARAARSPRSAPGGLMLRPSFALSGPRRAAQPRALNDSDRRGEG